MNQVMLLYKARRWQDVLDLCQAVNKRLPQTSPEQGDALLSLIQDARRRIGTGQPPASQPMRGMP
jgi:hypothetical protein